MNWIGVMPAIDPELTVACLESLHEDVRAHIVLVDNTVDGFPTPMTGWKLEPRRNLGVAASWNCGIDQMYRDGPVDQLWLMSTSVRYRKGGLDWVAQMDQADEYALGVAHLGWHLHGFTAKTIETVGRFDEHFYPAYFEDTDYLYRMHLLGLPCPVRNGRSWPYIFIDAHYGGDAQALKSGRVSIGDEPARYYQRKWGGLTLNESYDTPFNTGREPSWWP